MKIKLKIEQERDYARGITPYNVTSFLINHELKKSRKDFTRDGNNSCFNDRGEIEISTKRKGYKGTDREYAGLSQCIDRLLFHQRGYLIGSKNWEYYHENTSSDFTLYLSFKYRDGIVPVIITKSSRYTLNGKPLTKSMLLSSLSRLFYRTCFTISAVILKKYLRMLITTPPNVKYALENRTPYHFFDVNEDTPYRSNKMEVLINTQRISTTECALEISENIWYPIKVKELDRFLNVYRHRRKNKKWENISPARLWEVLSDETPSESQILVMRAWLKQNRTDKMVEDRAKQLMYEIDRENEEIINFTMTMDGKDRCAMFVRGKVADWILVENNAAKTSRQRVSIYCYHKCDMVNEDDSKINGKDDFLGGRLYGPICVDNSVGRVSLGDQFASRAFSLMNDKFSISLISTLKSAIPNNGLKNRINTVYLNKYRGALK